MSQRPDEPSGGDPTAGEPTAGEPTAAESRPSLLVVRGEPTAAELAALTVVVDALVRRGRPGGELERPAASRWAVKDHSMRLQLRPGPDAWRASALPS